MPAHRVAATLLAAGIIVGAGPLAAQAAPSPSVPPPASGLLGAVSGLTKVLPPVQITVGQGGGALKVTVDPGATVRRVLGAAPSTPASAPRTPTAHTPSPPRTPAPRPTVRRPHITAPPRHASPRPATHHAQPAAAHRVLPRHTRRVAPTVRADGPLSDPTKAVQQLLRWSLGSDRTMLVLLAVTAVGALAAMVTVLAMGRRPGLRRAPAA